MDLLDIQFRIEKTFDIPFSVGDFTEIFRNRDILVGDLYDLILKKMGSHDVARYNVGLNWALWTELQKVIHYVTQVPLDQVELKTPLENLFPRESRRDTWERLRSVFPYGIGALEYSRFVRPVGFLLAAAMVLVEQLRIWQIPGAIWLWPLLGILGVWIFVETYWKILSLLSPLRNRFPSGMKSVKDLCRTILATNYEKLSGDLEIPFDERSIAVWRQLTEILVAALGVNADDITFRSRLIADLGAE